MFGGPASMAFRGGDDFANLPFWKIALATTLSNIGRPGQGLDPLQLVMAQQQAQQQQKQRQDLTQVAQLGKYSQDGATSVNPFYGRAVPQMANSPEARLGAMAANNDIVAEALAKNNLSQMLGPRGYTGVLSEGQTAYQDGKPVANIPKSPEAPKPTDEMREYDAAKAQGFKGTFLQYKQAAAAATRAPDKPTETWRIMTPEEKSQAGIPVEGVYKTNGTDVQQVTPPRYDTSPGQQTVNKVVAEGNTLKKALGRFGDVVKNASTTDFASAFSGGKTSGGRVLNTAWTNAAMMSKAESLYNLGVLNGQDLTKIQEALPDPSTFGGMTTSKDAYAAAISEMMNLVDARTKEYVAAYSGGKSQEQATAPPANVDPAVWQFMTPEERALWK